MSTQPAPTQPAPMHPAPTPPAPTPSAPTQPTPADGRARVELVSGRRLFAELLAQALPSFAVHLIQPVHIDAGARAGTARPGAAQDRSHPGLGSGLLFEAGDGIVVIDVSPWLDAERTTAVLSQARAAGRRVVVLVDEGEPDNGARWVELGANALVTVTASPAELAETLDRVAKGETVMGVAVREGLLARLRTRRKDEQQRVAAFQHLTRRETAVLVQLAEGLSPEEIASTSYVSVNTIRTQVRGILTKLGVRSVVAAVAMSYRSGWMSGHSS